MPTINKANRQVCDVDIRDVSTMKPVMFFETANTEHLCRCSIRNV